jgi:putative transposase
MPDHVHGIVAIVDRGESSPEGGSSTDRLGSGAARLPDHEAVGDDSPVLRPGSLGAIVGNFKSVTARRVNRMRGSPGAPFWQRNYW